MRHLLAAALMAVLPLTAARAVDVTVSWTNPTEYTDSSPLSASDITQTRVEYGTCSGTAFGTRAGEVRTAGAVTSTRVTGLSPSTLCFRAFTTARGVESAASNVIVKVVAQPPPRPPVLTTIDTIAYRMTFPQNRILLSRIGTVPLRTACDSAYVVNGYHVVDRARVRWDGGIQPSVVLARCG